MSKVLIVDDHPVIRMAVRVLLERGGHEVVAEADNGLDAIQMATDLAPDIVILDIGIPKMDGVEVIKRLQTRELPLHVLVLTSQSPSLLAMRCMSAGASGFITKDGKLEELMHAIKAVLSGYTHFPKHSMSSVQQFTSSADESEVLKMLSDREMLVLQQLACGRTNKEIGDDMLLSNKTISTYKSRLMEKLKATTVVDLIEFAKRNNLA